VGHLKPNTTSKKDDSALCLACGLCCDGSLFADVELSNRVEADNMECLGLEVEEGDLTEHLLLQPCRALKGRCCQIYDYRPRVCRQFACKVLLDYQTGSLTKEEAMKIIRKARKMLSDEQSEGAKKWVARHFLGEHS
jgi:Fe-S-cluster containining protein